VALPCDESGVSYGIDHGRFWAVAEAVHGAGDLVVAIVDQRTL
jgi:hypothetical protein